MNKISIAKRQTKIHGIAHDLYFRWRGVRYRPLLGYDLSNEEAQRRAIVMVHRIQSGEINHVQPVKGTTLREFVPTYYSQLKVSGRIDLARPEQVLEDYFLPKWGDLPLRSLTASMGLEYISERQQAEAANGTILREWNILLRVLNLAVQYEELDKNRLAKVPLPKGSERDRVATEEELALIAAKGSPLLCRAMDVALNTGLREGKIIEIRPSWIRQRKDGPWLILPKPRSSLKRHPKELPLNKIAIAALANDIPSITDAPIFANWTTANHLSQEWARICKRAKITDLHFHDLRHTAGTRLQNLNVDYTVIRVFLGHLLEGTTRSYLHGGTGWDKKLRDGVNQLAGAHEMSYGCPMGRHPKMQVSDFGAGNGI